MYFWAAENVSLAVAAFDNNFGPLAFYKEGRKQSFTHYQESPTAAFSSSVGRKLKQSY